MQKGLEQRFIDFLESQTGFESIDNLNLTKEQIESSKADFFAQSRNFIIEIKSLETDTKDKVEAILEPHRTRPEFPHFYGAWELEKILKYLPNADEIRNQVIESITTSIKGLFRKANRQIRKTKEVFSLSDSKGILIILNDAVDILSPEMMAWKIRKLYAKKNPDGTSQVPNLDVALMISETHFTQLNTELMAFPILIQPNPLINYPDLLQNFVSSLLENWSKYNQAIYLRADFNNTKDLSNIPLKSVEESKKESNKFVPRHVAWRRYYKRNPYFRSYDDKMLLWMFEIIMTEQTPGFLKGSTQKQKDRVNFWIEVFTHFMEEVNHRGIDMKFFAPVMKRLGKAIEEDMSKKFPNPDSISN